MFDCASPNGLIRKFKDSKDQDSSIWTESEAIDTLEKCLLQC